MEPQPLWSPSPQRRAEANLARFAQRVAADHGARFDDYASLYDWSVRAPEKFWSTVWDFCGVIASQRGTTVLADAQRMPGARWFPEARLNFAENLLRRRDDDVALVFRGETRVRRSLSFRELHEAVSRLAQALRAEGVGPGDRVAAIVANMPEAIVGLLATSSLGAIWSSCSPDFGVQGILDRFGQIEPKVLLSVDGYFYAGKTHDNLGKLAQVLDALPGVRRAVVIPYVADGHDLAAMPRAVRLDHFIAPFAAGEIAFAQLPFDHPLAILYSSGTTGVPKCIVHGQGGTLLQHLKEHQLQTDLRRGDRLFYFTTCGWMMWNWLVSGLASGATLLLYDGSPFHPGASALWNYCDEERMTVFGTSAKYIDALAKLGLEPRRTHSLASLRTMTSTGSPLVAESFEYVYRNIKSDLLLSSISGGTDIVSCFVLGSPWLPVWRGEIQCRGLGMKVEVFDDDGQAVVGQKGELVCSAPFPSMPVMFWNDPGGAKYRTAYFERFPGVWCHGDWMELTPRGSCIIYGRSDATLNPGGVRIGTAEIYRQVERLEEVVESLVIGQDWDRDVRVVLFVRLREGLALDDALVKRIKDTVRANTTPRHVPAKVLQVADIPRTKSGKIVELAVRDVVHGRPVKNREALANPEALELFRDRPELAVR
ncbi:MAG: acetoacetate--CoA ligase [Betaproteobacteria bacterium]|nr:acetoacetate--CoA ligase [Rhodocyclaceae bacterium]MCA3135947.1 acetoacetate--CoA ligase [Rhodocyclaceae bacterium]MCA3143481.1 acetoacetate--CoA ligase [Rhodocyclaceae bacterium]MCA3146744.1 acetoacetate--CoA ligase [Rhodocyclaceae bacterium]MCE2899194.1 acetoacetate--CoA ligase [Betaproteobacteria bacterium]